MAEDKGKKEEKKPEDKGPTMFEYRSSDGQLVKLTLDIVKNYLVSGKKELVTVQELAYFMHICRARSLNPFTKECYLIKYGDDPAQIVTSIDFFRKRAKAQPDCVGWKVGTIVKRKDGSVKKTGGLVMEDETLLGAWFEAKPVGWAESFYKETNLKGYIKRTKGGDITRFWAPENQPDQIMKVAESQGLRRLWPDQFAGIHSEAQSQADPLPLIPEKTAEDEEKEVDAAFEKTYPEGVNNNTKALFDFLGKAAQIGNKSVIEIKKEALADLEGFWGAYKKYASKNGGNGGAAKAAKCPETGEAMDEEACKQCLFAKGCPAR